MGAHRLLRSRVSVGQTSNRRPTLTGPRLFCRSVSSGHRDLESSSGPEVTGSWRGFLCRKKHANVDWHSTVFGPMRDLEYIYFLPLSHSHEKKLRNIYQAAQFMKSFSILFLLSYFSLPTPAHILSLSLSHPRTLFWFLSHHEQTLYMIIAYICRFTEKEVDKQINIRGERDCVGSGTCRQVAFFFLLRLSM